MTFLGPAFSTCSKERLFFSSTSNCILSKKKKKKATAFSCTPRSFLHQKSWQLLYSLHLSPQEPFAGDGRHQIPPISIRPLTLIKTFFKLFVT
jgi:hypothetical protein